MKGLVFLFCLFASSWALVNPNIVQPTGFTKLRTSGQSTLYTIELPSSAHGYQYPPYLLDLQGSRHQIGYDYAALLHDETVTLFTGFIQSLFPSAQDQYLINMFLDYCWDSFLVKNTPQEYLDELKGMEDWSRENEKKGITADIVSRRFYTLANMPADTTNIIAMLEQELEGNWPEWLKSIVNYIIKLLEKYITGCDAYGVWGSRTKNGLLYSSRNLDWKKNTGIDRFKLVTFFTITDPKYPPLVGGTYASLGFASGLGALAGMSGKGITVSEMNLDNDKVTFSGLPFPLRLRYVMEHSTDLASATAAWKSTNNTNSFNFLIGSSYDANSKQNGALVLETIMDYTSFYQANSAVEAAATYDCPPHKCSWTNQNGTIHIGRPAPEAVWRSNHAFDPRIMSTQESLFNDTVFRYDLMADIFADLKTKKVAIDDAAAVSIAATLGTKGPNFYSCDTSNFPHGENVMSITYAPGPRGATSAFGHLFISWEQGGSAWRPAACNPYVMIDFNKWVKVEYGY